MSESNGTATAAAPQQLSASEAIQFLAHHALRAPLTPSEAQTAINLRDGLLKMTQPPTQAPESLPFTGKKKGR